MSSSPLETKLEAIARRFIAEVMGALGEASLSDLAAYSEQQRGARARPAAAAVSPRRTKVTGKAPTRERRSAANLSELEDRIVEELTSAAQPMGARAIANAVAVPVAKIGAPLKALRDAGRVKKIGDKRASVYAV